MMDFIQKIIAVTILILVTATVLIPVCEDYDDENSLAVMVLAGQSNAQYMPSVVDLSLMDAQGVPNHNVYYYGDSTPVIYRTPAAIVYDDTFRSYSIHSMLNANGSKWNIGCEDAQLALKLSNKLDCDVLIINVGIGAAKSSYFMPGHDGGNFINNVISKALNDINGRYDTIHKVGYVWIQGEADASTAINTYKSNFNQINNWFDSQGFKTCYMVQVRPENGGNASVAQLQIAQTTPNVILASTAPATFTQENGLLSSDGLHYTQAGRIVVANDVVNHVTYKIEESTSLISIIPVIVIVSIILMVVALYRSKNGVE